MNEYRIELPHIYQIEYIEGEKRMLVEVDLREPVITYGKSLLNGWEEPFENVPISSYERTRIYLNILEYLVERFGKEDINIIP